VPLNVRSKSQFEADRLKRDEGFIARLINPQRTIEGYRKDPKKVEVEKASLKVSVSPRSKSHKQLYFDRSIRL